MRLALVLVLFAACQYDDNLVRCGDLVCPAHTTCVSDRCVTAGQLESCADKAEADACAVDSRVGVCNSGVCTYVGCGNGVVEGDELCDDANTTFGDGCSGDCRSLETCGNGITDYLAGETCDCGTDAASRPEQCASPNSADPTTECSASCQLRFCGDGALDALEQCDGDLLGTATCSDFGYYHGAPTCSAGCLVDVDGCYGRCGDSDVEPAFGEFCDGTAPTGSCVTYGFDAGLPTCSDACSPDFSDCETFGWRLIDSRAGLGIAFAGTVPVIVGATADAGSNAWAMINNIRLDAPEGTYSVIVSYQGKAYAFANDHMAVWAGTSWTVAGIGWPATSNAPVAAWASLELGVFVVVDGSLWHFTTTWMQESLSGIVGVNGVGDTVSAWSTSQAWSSTNGGAFTADALPLIGPATLKLVLHRSGGPQWVAAGTQVYLYSQSAWGSTPNLNVRSGFLDDSGELIAAVSGGLVRMTSTAAFQQTFSNANAASVIQPADGGIAFAGVGGVQSLRTNAWTNTDIIYGCCAFYPYQNDRFDWLDIANDGETITGSSNDYALWFGAIAGGGGFQPQDAYTPPYDSSLLPTGIVVQAAENTVEDAGGTELYDARKYDTFGNFIGYRPIHAVDATRNGTVLATGEDAIVEVSEMSSTPVTVVIAMTGFDLYRADEAADGTIVVLGTSGGSNVILRIAPDHTTVTELATTNALKDIWVSPAGDAIAVGGTTVWHCPAQATSCTSESVGMTVNAVGATALDDVFIGGYAATGVFGALTHWDGSRWYAVHTPVNQINELVVQGNDIAYAYGGRTVPTLKRVARW